jgi:hypothetical protein
VRDNELYLCGHLHEESVRMIDDNTRYYEGIPQFDTMMISHEPFELVNTETVRYAEYNPHASYVSKQSRRLSR